MHRVLCESVAHTSDTGGSLGARFLALGGKGTGTKATLFSLYYSRHRCSSHIATVAPHSTPPATIERHHIDLAFTPATVALLLFHVAIVDRCHCHASFHAANHCSSSSKLLRSLSASHAIVAPSSPLPATVARHHVLLACSGIVALWWDWDCVALENVGSLGARFLALGGKGTGTKATLFSLYYSRHRCSSHIATVAPHSTPPATIERHHIDLAFTPATVALLLFHVAIVDRCHCHASFHAANHCSSSSKLLRSLSASHAIVAPSSPLPATVARHHVLLACSG
ncbi:hypothetical protein DEO72_LG6g453 [Vigna unguiculata]|uniref:Uncharacterized protein n=1 Tax=Vigna unguiculata TaxID=3917 RepID=A0A4D6M4K6_VIGUN|nr:hypothetical protein DEO72_LG6g453 [Vigna unguiculata]